MNKTKDRKPARTLILVMIVLVVVGVLIARSYYSNINNSVDPRIKPARLAYKTYNQQAIESNFTGVLKTLDTINLIYSQYPHYQDSYEIGVVHVNRSALYLTVGLHIDSLRINHDLGFMQTLTEKGLLDLAEEELEAGIENYRRWDSVYENLEPEEIEPFIKDLFLEGLEEYSEQEKDAFLEARVDEIETAQWENERRLSVAYTNLGTVFYHRDNFEKAAELFNQALSLWEDNLNAENNLNSMLGRPLRKRSFIQKMFPKERKKD